MAENGWTCQACTMANPGVVNECLTCGTPNGGDYLGGGGFGGGGDNTSTWICSACTMSNDVSASACHMCGTPNPNGTAAAVAPSPPDHPDWFELIWGPEGPPSSWTGQGLAFERATCSSVASGDGRTFTTKLAIKQKSNGPCGALATVQAAALAMNGCESGGDESIDADIALVDAIVAIIVQAAPSGNSKYCVATWTDADATPTSSTAEKVNISEHADEEDLRKALFSGLSQFKNAGGACLLVYSAVLTRGVELIKKDMEQSGGEPPLVIPPFSLCSSELLMLLVRGEANGNVGAYDLAVPGTIAQVSSASQPGQPPAVAVAGKVTWTSKLEVGMLSLDEADSGVPLADKLISPEKPVWIMHGGDHFTVSWMSNPLSSGESDMGKKFDMLHWNGLPPAGPRLAHMIVTAPSGSRGPAPKKHKPAYYKPIPGQIQDVVQALPDDKASRPGLYETWKYEVQLAVDDPDVSGEERPPDAPKPKVFEQGPPPSPGTSWRCATCYSKRFETMCFGVNEAGSEECRHCSKRREECGWTIWLAFEELPDAQKRQCARVHAPKILSLIQTKWPGAQVEYGDRMNHPAV